MTDLWDEREKGSVAAGRDNTISPVVKCDKTLEKTLALYSVAIIISVKSYNVHAWPRCIVNHVE